MHRSVSGLLSALSLALLALSIGTNAACPHVTYASGTRFSSLGLAGGTVVTIPAGQTYIFDMANSPLLGGVNVYGRLIFDEGNFMLHTMHVTVFNGGEFLIGACDCPYQGKARIELHDNGDFNHNPNGVGSKVLGVLGGGRLEFYGKVFGPTWTRLDQNAPVGATTLTLKSAVQWRPGDKIIVAGTGYVNGWYSNPTSWNEQTEEVDVVSVVGNVVTITPALRFAHQGETVDGVELRGEVGSLTRNIVIQGDPSSATSQFGAHTMFLQGSRIQLKGVEVTRAGQFRQLGRYPVHFHMFGDATGMAVEDCSIHHNYQRCFTFHGVHNLTAQRNVAYWTNGHCFFLEDGIETGNYIAHNLAVRTHKFTSPFLNKMPTDANPALFWVTHPSNHYIGNAAVSSPAHCMWIALPVHPTGPSNTLEVIPRHSPLGRFEHNSFHGCGNDCIHADSGPDQDGVADGSNDVNPIQAINAQNQTVSHTVGAGYLPYGSQYRTQFLKAGPQPAVFESVTTWKCQQHGVWIRGGPHHFPHFKSAGSRIGITLAVGRHSRVYDASFVGDVQNDYFGNYPIRGYEFYDGPNELQNARFSKFNRDASNDAGGISMLRKDRFTICPNNNAHQVLTIDAGTPLWHADLIHDGDKGSVIVDRDGTLTGRPPVNGFNKATVVNALPFHVTPGCVQSAGTNSYHCPNHFVHLRYSQDAPASYPTAAQAATMQGLWRITRQDKVGSPLYLCGEECNYTPDGDAINPNANSGFGTLVLYRNYYFHWMGPSVSKRATFVVMGHAWTANENGQAPYNEVTIGVCFPAGSSGPSITWTWRDNPTMASSFAAMKAATPTYNWNDRGNNMWYWDQSTGYVWVRFPMSNTEATQPFNSYGVYGTFTVRMATVGAGSGNCPMNGVAEMADTLRVLPPIGTPPTPPAFAPAPALDPWGAMSCGPQSIVHCEVSLWSSWSNCAGACGTTGSQTRSRTVTIPAQGGGNACPSLTDSQPCQMGPCPVDCSVTPWSGWGLCQGTCVAGVNSTGTQQRTRSVTSPAQHGGGCFPLIENQPCDIAPCAVPVHCLLSAWSAYGPCYGLCGGGGNQTRSRDVLVSPQNGGDPCGAIEEWQPCTPPCPTHCQVDIWGAWSPCVATCLEEPTAAGLQSRSREILTPPANGGNPCPELSEQQPCSLTCDVDCRVGQWSEWLPCEGVCSSFAGTQLRNRIISVRPVNNGSDCPALQETRTCTDPCTASVNTLNGAGQTHPTVVRLKVVAEDRVEFTVISQTTGYVAVSIPSQPGVMTGANAFIGYTGTNGAKISEYKIGQTRAFSCPDGVCEDASVDMINPTVTESNGFTTITFTRLKKTSDSTDQALVDAGQIQHLNVAAGDNDVIEYHGPNMASIQIVMPHFSLTAPSPSPAPTSNPPTAPAPVPSDSGPVPSPPAPQPSPPSESQPGETGGVLDQQVAGLSMWIWLVIGLAALVLIALIIVVVVVVVKKNAAKPSYRFDKF